MNKGGQACLRSRNERVWKANSIAESVARFIFVSLLLRQRIIGRWMVVDKLAVHFYAVTKKKGETRVSKLAHICWVDLHSLREPLYCKYLLRGYFSPISKKNYLKKYFSWTSRKSLISWFDWGFVKIQIIDKRCKRSASTSAIQKRDEEFA